MTPRSFSAFFAVSRSFPTTAGITLSEVTDSVALLEEPPIRPRRDAARKMMRKPMMTAAAIESAVIFFSRPGSSFPSSKSSL